MLCLLPNKKEKPRKESGAFVNGLFYRRNLDFAAVGADIFGGSFVAVDEGVSHRCSCAEFNRNSYADILRDRENTRAVSFAVAGDFSRRNNSCAAAFCERGACFGKRTDGYRYADRGGLIADSRTSLILQKSHIGIHCGNPLSVGILHSIRKGIFVFLKIIRRSGTIRCCTVAFRCL